MNLLTIENITKSYTERKLFDKVSLGINEGDKIGVIGINGTGKSTFLKILAGLEECDEGTIVKGKRVRISYLSQTPAFSDEKSLLENVLEGLKAEESYRNVEGEAKAMLERFGISNFHEKPSIFSGGQKKRAALVKTLLMPSDFLILDEPTNHLDSSMTEWLEEYLKKYTGAFIMITHDRYFLDCVTNKIVEIDRGKLYEYQTNYSGFLELKAEREEMQLATERKAKSLFREELAWIQRGARARSTKQKAHIQRFEALKNREKIVEEENVEMTAYSARLGKKTLEAINVSKSYGEQCLFRDFSYIFLSTDRIGIIGPNGCGKSTFLKMLLGIVQPDTGEIVTGTTVKIGYFSQENENLCLENKVLDEIRSIAEYVQTAEGEASASQMCEKFLFTGALQYTKIAKLSGGEKRRLYLLKILMQAPNVLILDEPTNDLDIQTLTILEDYLQEYAGIVITVSHDRYFLDKIANRIFAFEGNGEIVRYEGNYSDYRMKQMEKESVQEKPVVKKDTEFEGKASWKNKEQKLKFSYKEQKEYETIDDDIAQLEEKIAVLEQEIAEVATQYTKLDELMKQKAEAEQQLEQKMERWVYLNDLAEQIAQNK